MASEARTDAPAEADISARANVSATSAVDGPLNRGELALLFLPLFTVALGYGAVLPVLPSLLARLHAPARADGGLELHAGLLTALYIGAFVIAAPLWGKITDSRGPRSVMLLGLVGYAMATIGFGLATSLGAAYTARFIAGVFASGLLPATAAYIVAHCHEPARARHLGWVSAATILGFLVGPALAGVVHQIGGAPKSQAGVAWHLTAAPIFITSVIALASAVGIARGLGGRAGDAIRGASRMQFHAPPGALATRRVLLLSALGAFGLGAFEVGLSLQSQRVWGWSAGDVGYLFSVCSLVMLGLQLAVFERLQRRVAARRLIIAGFATMAAGFVLLSSATAYAAVLGLVAVIALGSGVLLPTLSVTTADQAGAAVGTAVGIQNAAGNLGQAAGSVAAGVLFGTLPHGSFGVVAGMMFVGALAAAWRVAPRALRSDVENGSR